MIKFAGDNDGDILRKSIYYNKNRIYGAFPTFDESVISFEGVPKVSKLENWQFYGFFD